MRGFIALLTIVILVSTASAQTATPTVAPALSEAYYEFESISAPSAQIIGASTTTHMSRTVLVLATGGSVRFSSNASYLVIYYNSSVSAGSITMSIAVNNVPVSTVTVFDTEIYSSIWIPLGGGTKEISITRTAGTIQLYLDYMVLLNGSMIAAPTVTPGATPTAITPTAFVIFIPQPATPSVATATATPQTSYYVDTTAESTEYPAIAYVVDRTITAGDGINAVIGIALIALILVLIGVSLWKQ